MMAMGSLYPFMGAAQYPMSHIAGAYGMYGPNSPMNVGETYNNISGSSPDEERPAVETIGSARKLKIQTIHSDLAIQNEADRELEDLETSKQRLINTLEESLRQLKS